MEEGRCSSSALIGRIVEEKELTAMSDSDYFAELGRVNNTIIDFFEKYKNYKHITVPAQYLIDVSYQYMAFVNSSWAKQIELRKQLSEVLTENDDMFSELQQCSQLLDAVTAQPSPKSFDDIEQWLEGLETALNEFAKAEERLCGTDTSAAAEGQK